MIMDNSYVISNYMFEATFINLFDTDNASDYLVNFASGIATIPTDEQSLLKTLDECSQGATYFMRQRLILSENIMRLKSFYDPMKNIDRNAKDIPRSIQQCNNQW